MTSTYVLHGDNVELKRERDTYQNVINYYQRRIKEIDKILKGNVDEK